MLFFVYCNTIYYSSTVCSVRKPSRLLFSFLLFYGIENTREKGKKGFYLFLIFSSSLLPPKNNDFFNNDDDAYIQ